MLNTAKCHFKHKISYIFVLELFSVKLSLIFNTATVTDITTDHNFHRHINMKTFTSEKISHLLVHSVGKWCTLGRGKGFQLIAKSSTEIS